MDQDQPPCQYDRDEFLKHREAIRVEGQKAIETFDKAMLTLASSSIGVTLFLVEKLAPFDEGTLDLLIWTWVSLGSAVMTILASFICSHMAIEKYRRDLENYYCRRVTQLSQSNIPSVVTAWLNWFSIGTFTIGIVFLMVFAATAAHRSDNMCDSRPDTPITEPTPIRKGNPGAPAPPPPQPVPVPAPAPKEVPLSEPTPTPPPSQDAPG